MPALKPKTAWVLGLLPGGSSRVLEGESRFLDKRQAPSAASERDSQGPVMVAGVALGTKVLGMAAIPPIPSVWPPARRVVLGAGSCTSLGRGTRLDQMDDGVWRQKVVLSSCWGRGSRVPMTLVGLRSFAVRSVAPGRVCVPRTGFPVSLVALPAGRLCCFHGRRYSCRASIALPSPVLKEGREFGLEPLDYSRSVPG